MAQQQLEADYERVKAEESEKSNKLQELMSVDILNIPNSKLSLPLNTSLNKNDNKSIYYNIQQSNSQQWEKFLPYKNEFDSFNNKSVPKYEKDTLNNMRKLKNQSITSIFHIHTFHLHLFLSLTLLLVTHRCPQFLVVI